MTENRDISVIVPTYNSIELLKRTISSLEGQAPDAGFFQVVVVDDGSTDGTDEWLSEYSGCLSLTPIMLVENRGRSAARNIGVKHSTGSLIVFIDGDMEFSPNFVNLHKHSHNGNRTVAVGKVVYDRSLNSRGYTRYLEGRGALKLSSGQSVPGRYFLSGNSSLTRELFDSVGDFDEQFDYGEDIDFGLRLVDAGGKLIYNPDLTVTHLHTRSLQDTMSTVWEYGLKTVPNLTAKHPELTDDLRLDWLGSSVFSRLLRDLILSKWVYKLVYTFASVFNNWFVPAFIYNYLIFYSYYRGYQQSGNNS